MSSKGELTRWLEIDGILCGVHSVIGVRCGHDCLASSSSFASERWRRKDRRKVFVRFSAAAPCAPAERFGIRMNSSSALRREPVRSISEALRTSLRCEIVKNEKNCELSDKTTT
jgi:hypothetical protein